MGIGARLKEAREAKELSLESLQDTTKIQKRYLVAIEEENFSILPGKFYAKAFIREYAIAVGLDPNQLMEEYKQDIPSPEEETSTQYTRIHRSRKDNMPTKSTAIFSFIPTLIVILLIIGIIFLAWWFLTKTDGEDETTPIEQNGDNTIIRGEEPDTSNDQNQDDIDSQDTEGQEESNEEITDEEEADEDTAEEPIEEEPTMSMIVTEQGSGPLPVSTIELSNIGDELIFTFESVEGVWLDVKDANGQPFYGAITDPNESPMELDLTGQDRIFLNIGYAPNLTIKINGTEVEYPVDAKENDHQQIWFEVVESDE